MSGLQQKKLYHGLHKRAPQSTGRQSMQIYIAKMITKIFFQFCFIHLLADFLFLLCPSVHSGHLPVVKKIPELAI